MVARPNLAKDRLNGWFANLIRFPGLASMVRRQPVGALLAAIADHSPYLWRLAETAPGRLERLLATPPLRSFENCLDELAAGCAATESGAEAMSLLRRAKAEVALLVAIADLGGVWDLDEVVGALTRFADMAIDCAVAFLLREAARTGKLAADPARPTENCGITVLALGKGGGGELNYSSDVDLVVLFDPAASALVAGQAASPFYVRLTQQLVRLLAERTAEGYVFRVDLRLRPDPGSTAVAISLPAAFAYYESFGQNWERAAYVKARPIAGDRTLGSSFLTDLAPFIWRKYFDYAAIADIHAMKRQIHAVRGHAEVVVPGHDVKLGRGGIREIEFFVQTQQLIFGGRRPQLRGARTLDMLAALEADGWIAAEATFDLSEAYRFLRRVEHRLQMLADEQTQRLPSDPEALASFARWAGYETYDAFAEIITCHMRAVEHHYERLFEHAPGLDVEAGSLVFTGATIDAETVETLRRLGFTRPTEAVETVRGWHFGRRAAVQSPRAREVLTELVPALLLAFSGSGDPDAALIAFDGALARMPAAVELFTILKSNAALRELFADILGLAPRLAATVARRPHLLDIAIDPATLRGAGSAFEPRVAALDPALPREDFLDRARDVAQEEMFLIGVRLLAGTDDPVRAGENYSDLAAAIVRATLAHCLASFSAEYGEVPGASCVVVALGKLGSREMAATSDLDLLLIYDFDLARPESDGPRQIDAVRYYTRLTQRLVAALTVATRRGRLYEVDMRLRPSGNQGPLATQLRSFVAYQRGGSELWEHMALTRARVIAGDAALAARVERAIEASLSRPRGDDIRQTIADLRALVAREKGDTDIWNLKLVAGGLLDIDFLAQYLALRHAADHPSVLRGASVPILAEAARLSVIDAAIAETLVAAYRLYTNVSQIIRLTTEGRFDPAEAGAGLVRRLIAAADLPDLATLDRELAGSRAAVRQAFDAILKTPGKL